MYLFFVCVCVYVRMHVCFFFMCMYAQSADVLQLSYATLTNNLGMHDRLLIAHR